MKNDKMIKRGGIWSGSKKARMLMLAVAPAALLAGTSTQAATDTWTGGGGNGNWTNPLNWGGTAPVAGDSLVFSGATNVTTNNDFAAGTLFNSITFDSTAGVFTLGGNRVLLGSGSNGTLSVSNNLLSSSVVNNSANTETISLALTLSNLTASEPFGGNHLIMSNAGNIALSPSGGLARSLGSSAQFAGPLTTTTLTNDATGIIGGWATFGASTSTAGITFSSDLAAVVGGQIVAYTGYNNISGAAAIASSPGTNYKWSGSTSPGTLVSTGITDFNSLTFTDTTAATINMAAGQTIRVGVTGTIFRTGASDTGLQIGNAAGVGTLTAGGPNANTAGELILDANSAGDPNPGITVDAVITDNGTGKVSLVKTGDGAVVLQPGAPNTFTGDIYINQGKLRDQTAGAFGRGANIYVYNGGQAYFQTADVVPQNIFLSGLGVSEGGAFIGGAMRLSGNGALLTGTVTLTGDTRVTARGATGTGGMISGQITGSANLELGGAATGVLILTNPGNNWTGNTTISSGTTRLGANEVLPSGAGKGNVIINGDGNGAGASILDLFGQTQTINGLSLGLTAASANVTNSTGVATLNIGANNTTSQYDGPFTTSGTGTTNLNKIGSGTFTLTSGAAGNFVGNATVVGGKLVLASSAGFTANLATSGGATGGKLDVSAFGASGFVLSSGQTLTSNSSPAGGGVIGSINVGGGTIAGTGSIGGAGDTVTTGGGGSMHPGASAGDGSVGTLTLPSLLVNGGDYRVDAAGAGDKIIVTGTATMNGGNTITVAPNSVAGTYTILTAGSLVNNVAPALTATTVGRSTFSLNFATANTIKLTVTGGSGNLTWNNAAGGDGSSWDIQTNQNWSSTATTGVASQYYEADNVTFNDGNAGHYTVNISGTVNPASVTVNNSAGDYAFNGGVIGGTTALTMSGSRSLTLNNANTYSGGTNLTNGTLVINNGSAIGSGPLNISGGALGNTNGGLTLGTTNVINVNGSFGFTGPNDLSLGANTMVLNTNATITVGAGNLTLAGPIVNGTAGNGFTKAGPGKLILSVASTYSGALNVTGGIVQLGNAGGLGALTGPTNINGGTVDINALALNTTEQFNVSGTGFGGLGALVNNGANQTGNEISRFSLTGNASIGGTGRWDFRNNGPIIDLGGFNLTKVGTNQISIVSATVKNTGTGPNTIEVTSGFLTVESLTTTLGTNGSFLFDANISLQVFANTGSVTWPMTFAGNNTIGNASATTATIGSNATIKGNVTFVPLAAGVASLGSNFPLTWTGSIGESGGSFSVTKQGPAQTLTLSGNNSWSGGTNLQAGTLRAGSSGALPATGVVTMSDVAGDAAILDLNGNTVTVGGVVNIGPNSAAATIGNGGTVPAVLNYTGNVATPSSFSGIIQDVVGTGTSTTALTVSSGSLTLTAVNTYTGPTTVAGGTLTIASSGDIPSTTALTNNGTVNFNSATRTVASLNGTGAGAAVNLNGTNFTATTGGTYAGAINDNGTNGTLTVPVALSVGSFNVGTVNANANVQIHATSKTAALNLAGGTAAWTTGLDLTTSKFILESTLANKTADLTRTRDQVTFGKTHTSGIFTSSTLGSTFAIAVLDNGVLNKPTFGGVAVDANSVMVSAELLGDSNADGHVDLTDLSTVLNNFGSTTAAWTSGNFDGAPTIDLTDLSDVLNNFGLTNPNAFTAASSGGVVATGTPEPASLAVLGLGAAALLGRRRRA